MKLITSKNGKGGLKSASNTASRVTSDLVVKTSLVGEAVNIAFNFAGAWKMLGLETNGLCLGLNDSDLPCVFVTADTDKRVQVFGRSKKSESAKSKIVKIDRFAEILHASGLIQGVKVQGGFIDGFNSSVFFNQYLSLTKIENDIDADGITATYQVVASETPSGMVAIKVPSAETVAKIQASRAANKAAKA